MLSWAKSIACYMIAISLLMGILPEGNYKKYVKFFTGVVMSLLLLTPVMKLFSIDTSMASNYNNELSKLWSEQLDGQEEKNLEGFIENTVSSMGYELNKIQYEKSSKGEIVGVLIYVDEKCENVEASKFEVPVILIPQVEKIEEIQINKNQNEMNLNKGENSSIETNAISALKEVIAVLCEVEVTIILQ